MKVLFVVPYFYSKELKGFDKNKTGFGIMISQMLDYIGKETEILVFSNVLTNQKTYKNSTILKHTAFDVALHSGIKNIFKAIKSVFKYKGGFKDRLKQMYYSLNCGYLEYIIKKNSPDIIHCHGIGDANTFYNSVCYGFGVPVVTTLHGLNAMICKYGAEKHKNEIDFLRWAEAEKAPITVISSGIKKRLNNQPWQLSNTDNIKVITNGTNLQLAKSLADRHLLLEKYNIPIDRKIAVAVGSIYDNKNQLQIVRAVSLIPKKERNITVFICGNDTTNGKFQEEIEKYDVVDSFVLLGFLDQAQLHKIYGIADFNILASLQEGFGLSIIEAFSHGVPTLTFSDLDAVDDLYNEKCMLLCPTRNDKEFADYIKKMLTSEWDKEWITNYSKQFSLEAMAQKYIDFYKEVISSDRK